MTHRGQSPRTPWLFYAGAEQSSTGRLLRRAFQVCQATRRLEHQPPWSLYCCGWVAFCVFNGGVFEDPATGVTPEDEAVVASSEGLYFGALT